jgi:hypothetical protein
LLLITKEKEERLDIKEGFFDEQYKICDYSRHYPTGFISWSQAHISPRGSKCSRQLDEQTNIDTLEHQIRH